MLNDLLKEAVLVLRCIQVVGLRVHSQGMLPQIPMGCMCETWLKLHISNCFFLHIASRKLTIRYPKEKSVATRRAAEGKLRGWVKIVRIHLQAVTMRDCERL